MKLSYPQIFQGGELDTEIDACGLNRAVKRFFLHLASGYHTFWQDGVRIQLSDAESQLLESGAAFFSSMECEPVVKRVMRGNLAMPYYQVAGTPADLAFSILEINTEYLTWLNEVATCVIGGSYLITASVRVDGGQSSVANFVHYLTCRKNGNIASIAQNLRDTPDQTLHITLVLPMVAGDTFRFQYYQNTGVTVILRTGTNSQFQVMYLGE